TIAGTVAGFAVAIGLGLMFLGGGAEPPGSAPPFPTVVMAQAGPPSPVSTVVTRRTTGASPDSSSSQFDIYLVDDEEEAAYIQSLAEGVATVEQQASRPHDFAVLVVGPAEENTTLVHFLDELPAEAAIIAVIHDLRHPAGP